MAEQRKSDIRHFRDLDVYRRAFDAAMKIFELTKTFPSDERFSMVDQMRRASRSVCSNIADDVFQNLDAEYEGFIGMLSSMEMKSEKFCYVERGNTKGRKKEGKKVRS